MSSQIGYTFDVIVSFRNKPLAELWSSGKSSIDARLRKRLLLRLGVINAAASLDDINLPGYNFHPLRGFDPTRYTVHVNGPWCITFEFQDGEAFRVDFEQYH